MEELKRYIGIVISTSTLAVVITIFIYQNFTTKSEAQAMQIEIKENKEEIVKRLERIENKIDRIYSEFN